MAIVWPPDAALAEQLVQPEDRGHLRGRVGAPEGAGLRRRARLRVGEVGGGVVVLRTAPPTPGSPHRGYRRRWGWRPGPGPPGPTSGAAWRVRGTGRRGRPPPSRRPRERRGPAAMPCSRSPAPGAEPGPTRAVCRTRPTPRRRCRAPAARGYPVRGAHGQPFGAQCRGHPCHLGLGRAERRGVLGRGQVAPVVGRAGSRSAAEGRLRSSPAGSRPASVTARSRTWMGGADPRCTTRRGCAAPPQGSATLPCSCRRGRVRTRHHRGGEGTGSERDGAHDGRQHASAMSRLLTNRPPCPRAGARPVTRASGFRTAGATARSTPDPRARQDDTAGGRPPRGRRGGTRSPPRARATTHPCSGRRAGAPEPPG